ncbi:MAG: Ig-like domain-containing protein, partial [Myxococcota bacterium]
LEPPTLASVTLEPTVGNRETEFVLTVNVNEALAEDPAVSYVTGIDSVSVASSSASDLQFIYRFRADATLEEGIYALQAVVTDVAGNSLRIPLGASFELDTTEPALVERSASTTLRPNRDPNSGYPVNPLDAAEQLTVGTELEANFVVDEVPSAARLDAVDTVSGEVFAGLVFTLDGSLGASLRFNLDRAVSAPASGTYDLVASVDDLAGNTGTLIVAAALVVDTDIPNPASVAPEAIVHFRRPTGDGTSTDALTRIVGQAGAVEAGATVLIETPLGAELAQAVAGAEGEFQLELAGLDVAELETRVVDAAGNASTRAPITYGCFTSNLDERTNSRLSAAAIFSQARLPALAREIPTATRPDRLDQTSATTSSALHWRQLRTGDAPFRRFGHAAAYDSNRDTLVVRGGFSPLLLVGGVPTLVANPAEEQWERAGSAWRLTTVSDPEGDESPPFPQATSEDGLVMSFDPSSGLVVTAPDENGATWAWNGASWRVLSEDTNLSSGKKAITYDSRRRELLVFVAGNGTYALRGERWQQLCTTSPCSDTAPAPIDFFSMTYDEVLDEVVLFTGAETWIYSPDVPAWEKRCDATLCPGGPAARSGVALAYHRALNRTVLYGGCHTRGDPWCNRFYFDTWEWNGSQWTCAFDGQTVPARGPSPETSVCNTEVAAATNGGGAVYEFIPQTIPAQGDRAVMVYDGLRSEVLLVGGQAFGNQDLGHEPSDWAWNGTAWREVNWRTPNGLDRSMAPHESTGVVVFPESASTTWVWDGLTWAKDAGASSSVSGAPIAYNPRDDELVLFTGNSETWTYVPETGWERRCDGDPAGDVCTAVPNRSGGELAYHRELETIVYSSVVAGMFGDEPQFRFWRDGDWQEPV